MTAKKTTNEAHKLKEMMHREAGGVVKKQLLEYLRCLKEGGQDNGSLMWS